MTLDGNSHEVHLVEAKETYLGLLEMYIHMDNGLILIVLDMKTSFIPLWVEEDVGAAFLYFDLFRAAAATRSIKKLTNIETGDIIYL